MNNKSTYTSLFLLPALEIDEARLNTLGCINAYLGDKGAVEYKDSLYVLFKCKDQVMLSNFMAEREDIRDDYDYPGGFTVLVFEFPSKHMVNYFLFKEGKYSKFTKNYQRLFRATASIKEKEFYRSIGKAWDKSRCYMVFNKSPQYRILLEDSLGVTLSDNDELWSIPSLEEETLDINTFSSTPQTKEV